MRLFCVLTMFFVWQATALPQTNGSSCSRVLRSTSEPLDSSSRGKWRIFCPHAAAETVVEVSSESMSQADAVASALRKEKSSQSWDYVRVTTKKVPGLTEDEYRDYKNPHDIHVLLYPSGKDTVGNATMWGH